MSSPQCFRPLGRLSGGARRALPALLLAGAFSGHDLTSAETAPALNENIRSILEANCYDCHAEGSKKGGVSFDTHKSDADLLADAELWHRVLKNVRAGLMPPPNKDQPTPDERKLLQAWIKKDVFQIDPAQPDPGRPVLRRLNRNEYRNTIRDLTGVDFKVNEEFPSDDTGQGFDNIGEVLTLSPMMLEKYLSAAKAIVRKTVPQVGRRMPEQQIWSDRFFRQTTRDGATVKGEQTGKLSYYEPMTVAATVEVAHPGKYTVTFDLSGEDRFVEGAYDLNRCRITLKADGQTLASHEFPHVEGRSFSYPFTREWTAGKHEVSVELERLTPDEKQLRSLALRIDKVTVGGPSDTGFWKRPEGHEKWFPRDVPDDPAQRLAYASEVLGSFAAKAFRRPLQDDTARRLAQLAESVWSQPGECFESGVSRAMEAVLASPRFLFMEEFSKAPEPGRKHPLVDEHTLASRLSYFLWSSMPDAELTRLADEGKLRASLAAQFKRLLDDPKSQAFFRNFPGQWLQARDVEGIAIDARFVMLREEKPDPDSEEARRVFLELRKKGDDLTPEEREKMDKARSVFRKSFDRFKDASLRGEVRRDMRRETELYFEHVIRQDRPLTELIDSDYTFLNSRLAKHYGIQGVEGEELKKVTLPPDSERGGLLTQGSFLVVSSNPTRTSPVKRGLYILENILGTPPPPPPPNIPALDEPSGRNGRVVEVSLRETLEKHRADAKCASCHNRMDPLGLALENFNALGRWRDSERGMKLDPAGQLVSGEKFTGARELKKILVANHRDEFHRCLIEKLLTCALGRGLDHRDEATLDALLARLEQNGGRASALLEGIVQSDAFQRRRAPETK